MNQDKSSSDQESPLDLVQPPIRLRVVTYNVRKGKGIRGSRPSPMDFTQALNGLGADLLLCQEVFYGSVGRQQGFEIANALDLLHRYEPNARYRRGHHGNATFSRFPIGAHENRDISTNRIEQRGVLYTRIEPIPRAVVHVFNTHFGLNHGQRVRQAEAVAQMVSELVDPADPVLLAGDFNDWSGRVDSKITSATGLDNAMLRLALKDRRTWSTKRPLFALDRIYFRNLRLAEVEVLRNAPFDGLSDHFPVTATLELIPSRVL